jgi:hypothetical protein
MDISNFLTNSSINFTYVIFAHISKFRKPLPALNYAISTQISNVIMQSVKKVLLHEHFETQHNLKGVIYFLKIQRHHIKPTRTYLISLELWSFHNIFKFHRLNFSQLRDQHVLYFIEVIISSMFQVMKSKNLECTKKLNERHYIHFYFVSIFDFTKMTIF